MTVILITGPSRSGKSEWAEQLAERLSEQPANQPEQPVGQLSGQGTRQVVYVATAMANENDQEWCDRIQKHIQRRPDHWQIEEIPIAIASLIEQAKATDCLLIDSLGTWLANLIEQDDAQWAIAQETLLKALAQSAAVVILVAEETGWGIVPAYELGRRFRDRLGSLSRAVGEIADDVYLVTSGYAINLSTIGTAIRNR